MKKLSELIRIDIISAIPDIFDSFLSTSIVKIAQEKGLAKIVIHDLHKFADNKFGHIDDYPYGGAAGMLIMCEPIFKCIEKLKSERNYDDIIYTAPEGKVLNQSIANELSLKQNLIILCGHYKGIDQRVRDVLITREISIGDVVLSGGEIPAMTITDSVIRLLPNVLGDSTSALDDSFMDGIFEAPQYTRPSNYKGMEVPEVLLSGDPKKISAWQEKESILKTQKLRPDLLD
ncbi:MAG: tRNA (guanosine(37)-N1)-methyltransferase TrmD [Candidatus Kapabacteria bacterium]|nr:tRNA (guanosine(37)-N1)-methyltransferase TrmD [Candidatus Kapabacteria bacterium]